LFCYDRSLTGEGNFNWRFVFDFDYLEIEEKVAYEGKDSVFQMGNTLKKIPPRVVIRVYDADILSSDDFLGLKFCIYFRSIYQMKFVLGECILDMTHLPIGAKASSKCKGDILLNTAHQSINLFANKRLSGKINFSLSMIVI
jgi:hypothetical protein